MTTSTPRRLTPQLVSRSPADATAAFPVGLPGPIAADGSPTAESSGAGPAFGLEDLPEPLRQRVLGSPEPGEADPWQLWLAAKEALAQEVLQVRTTSSTATKTIHASFHDEVGQDAARLTMS